MSSVPDSAPLNEAPASPPSTERLDEAVASPGDAGSGQQQAEIEIEMTETKVDGTEEAKTDGDHDHDHHDHHDHQHGEAAAPETAAWFHDQELCNTTFLGAICLDIEDSPEGIKFLNEEIVAPLRRAGSICEPNGIRVQAFYSSTHRGRPRSILVKIYASITRLLLEAARTQYPLKVDPERLRARDVAYNKQRPVSWYYDPDHPEVKSGNIDLSIPELQTRFAHKFSSYDFVYAPIRFPLDPMSLEDPIMHETCDHGHTFTQDEARAALFEEHKNSNSVLSITDSLKLLLNILEAPKENNGADIHLDREVSYRQSGFLCCGRDKKDDGEGGKKRGVLKRYFPAHDYRAKKLQRKWLTWCSWPWNVPVNSIRKYFGEHVGMYFAFLAVYTQALMLPALVGTGIFVHQALSDNVSVGWLPGFGIGVTLWVTLFLEYWKRTQSRTAMMWGMSRFEQVEVLRPQFTNTANRQRSVITGHRTYVEPFWTYWLKLLASYTFITTFIGCVLIAVFGIFVLRVVLEDEEEDEDGSLREGWGGYIASILNAFQILIMSRVYRWLARKLTTWENHRTETAHNDSLVMKTCLFQFVNAYISLWYIAFIKENIELFGSKQTCTENDDGEPDCMVELQSQLAIIFLTKMVFDNIKEILLPILKPCVVKLWRRCKRSEPDAQHRSSIEVESDLVEYDPFDDYLELLVQFGYASMFVVAFPLAPLLALLTNAVELRVDSHKLLRFSRRPRPRGAQDIGRWQPFLELLGYAAVVTNLAVSVFTDKTTFFGYESNFEKTLAFLFCEHIVLFIKYFGAKLISDSPYDVEVQLGRQRYLTEKHFNGLDEAVVRGVFDGAAIEGRSSRHVPAGAAGAGAGGATAETDDVIIHENEGLALDAAAQDKTFQLFDGRSGRRATLVATAADGVSLHAMFGLEGPTAMARTLSVSDAE